MFFTRVSLDQNSSHTIEASKSDTNQAASADRFRSVAKKSHGHRDREVRGEEKDMRTVRRDHRGERSGGIVRENGICLARHI